MISLAFHGFGIAQTAALKLAENPESGVWSFLKYQMSHVEWLGCSYWDLIQPSFMFMVGLSMAYSYVKRQREGHSYQRMLGHAFVRSSTKNSHFAEPFASPFLFAAKNCAK